MAGNGSVLLQRIIEILVDPAIKVLFTAGLLLFFWGIVEFLISISQGKPDDAGKQHMLYGLLGMLIMVSVGGIIALIMNSLGIDINSATDVSRFNSVNPGAGFINSTQNAGFGGPWGPY